MVLRYLIVVLMCYLSSVWASDLKSDLAFFESLQPKKAVKENQRPLKLKENEKRSGKKGQEMSQIMRFQSNITRGDDILVSARTQFQVTILNGYDSRQTNQIIYARINSKKLPFKDALLIGRVVSVNKEEIQFRFTSIEFTDQKQATVSIVGSVKGQYISKTGEKIITSLIDTAGQVLSSRISNIGSFKEAESFIPKSNTISYTTVDQGTLMDVFFDRTQTLRKT